jgi:hypothetical protein
VVAERCWQEASLSEYVPVDYGIRFSGPVTAPPYSPPAASGMASDPVVNYIVLPFRVLSSARHLAKIASEFIRSGLLDLTNALLL